jgi:carboxylate-amine ligase
MSYRTKLFEALPLAGGYEFIRDWNHFVEEVETLMGYGIIGGIKDLWWDARPSPQFGTVEVRICDLPTRFRDILAIVSLVQGTVAWIVEEDVRTGPLNPYILKANKWQSLRHGLGGRFVDPAALLTDAPVSYAGAAELLLSRVRRHGADLGSLRYLDGVSMIISEGTGAEKQRRIYQQTGDFKEMVRINQQGFWE